MEEKKHIIALLQLIDKLVSDDYDPTDSETEAIVELTTKYL